MMLNQFSLQPWLLRLAGAFLAGTLSVAVAAPPTADYKQGSKVTIKASGLPAGSQLALIPGGPYLKTGTALKNPVLALAINGSNAYAAAGKSGLLVFGLAPDAPPHLLAKVQGQGKITRVALQDGYAYLADSAGALLIVDVRDPQHPQEISRYPYTSQIDALSVEQERAYLVSGKNLAVLDVSKPHAPQQLASFTLANAATALQVVEGHAYLAMPKAGMSILDVRDPASIHEVGRFRGDVSNLAIVQGHAYLANGTTGLTVVDVSEPKNPRWLGSVNRPGTALALYYDDGYVALRNDRSEIVLIDVHNPKFPKTVAVHRMAHSFNAIALSQKHALAGTDSTFETIDFSAPTPDVVSIGANLGGSRRAVIRDNILYVADWFSGLHMYDISKPGSLRHIAAYHTQGSPKGVLVRGDYAFVADDDHGVQIINISNPEQPRKISEVATPGLAYTMKLVGDYLYLADHRGGFIIISVADIAHPVIVGSAPTADKAWAVEVAGKLAYVAADTAGLLVFDVSDPKQPKQINAYNIGGAAEDVVIRDHLAYVANFDNGFHIIDISQPAHLHEIGHISTPGNARSIELDGNIAYVADWVSGIQVVDITDPKKPALAGAYDTVGWSWGVLVKEHYAYVLDWWGGITVLDVSDPAAPVWAGAYHTRGLTSDVTVRDGYAYVADGKNGLQLFDVKNTAYPIWIAGVDMAGDAQSVWLEKNTAYLACGAGGLVAVDVSNPFEPQLRKQYPMQADQVRAQGNLVYAAERQHGVAIIDAATGKQTAWYAADVQDIWPGAHNRLLLATPKGVEIVGMEDPAQPHLIKRLPQRAGLVRAQDKLLVLYNKATGIALYDYATLKLLSRFNPGEEIFDMKISGDRLYASGSLSGLLVLDISNLRHPTLKAAYPAASRATRFSLYSGAAFMAGNETLASVRLLPDVTITPNKKGGITVNTPPKLPLGSYHLLALDGKSGKRALRYDVLRVAMPAPKTPRYNMQDFERAMRERGLVPKPQH